MKCEFCEGETTSKKVRKQHWHEGRLYIVEDVETEVCRECGERYFHARILDAIDAMIKREHDVKEVLSVEVLTAQSLTSQADEELYH
ncbi:MAG: YgiT-type zinc finger protein [Pseudomonadota bacterium]